MSSPQDWRLRFVAGVFYQRQQHRIEQRYKVDDLGSDYEVTGWSDTIWLTEQKRVDRDYAIFGEGSFDITEKLTFTGGIRLFRYKNSLEGFFGFGDGWSTSGRSGEALCSIHAGDPVGDESSWKPFKSIGTAPCTNLDRTVEDDDYTPKVNVSYRFDDSRMVYFTWSKGFRPGGVNRRGTFPPYKADFLTNYELGWKTAWASDRVRLNGAFFWEDWKDFQFSFLGENGLTNVTQRRWRAHLGDRERPRVGGDRQPAHHRGRLDPRRRAHRGLLQEPRSAGQSASACAVHRKPVPESGRLGNQRLCARGHRPSHSSRLQAQPHRALQLRPRPLRLVLPGVGGVGGRSRAPRWFRRTRRSSAERTTPMGSWTSRSASRTSSSTPSSSSTTRSTSAPTSLASRSAIRRPVQNRTS